MGGKVGVSIANLISYAVSLFKHSKTQRLFVILDLSGGSELHGGTAALLSTVRRRCGGLQRNRKGGSKRTVEPGGAKNRGTGRSKETVEPWPAKGNRGSGNRENREGSRVLNTASV